MYHVQQNCSVYYFVVFVCVLKHVYIVHVTHISIVRADATHTHTHRPFTIYLVKPCILSTPFVIAHTFTRTTKADGAHARHQRNTTKSHIANTDAVLCGWLTRLRIQTAASPTKRLRHGIAPVEYTLITGV